MAAINQPIGVVMNAMPSFTMPPVRSGMSLTRVAKGPMMPLSNGPIMPHPLIATGIAAKPKATLSKFSMTGANHPAALRTCSKPPSKEPIKLSPPCFHTWKSSISMPTAVMRASKRPIGLFIKAVFITKMAAVTPPIILIMVLKSVLCLVYQSIMLETTSKAVLPKATKLFAIAISMLIRLRSTKAILLIFSVKTRRKS